MPRTEDFKIDLGTLTLADGAQITTQLTADIESDDEGTYFVLTGLRWEGARVEAADWRWSAVSEWIGQNAREPFGIIREAHLKATSGEARADDLGCHKHHQRAA